MMPPVGEINIKQDRSMRSQPKGLNNFMYTAKDYIKLIGKVPL